ncbi:MAG: sugar-binding transcriptional regulator [Firmicutes bacterium]|nr:sugar-binding transcriptional regulator [Bacillota bacterium]
MDNLAVIRKIAPEIAELVEKRYTILRNIYFVQPVGRRALAARLRLPERTVRNEIELLREQGLLVSNPAGMQVTDAGERILGDLKEYVRELRGLSGLERRLAQLLGLQQVIIVPGDSDEDETVKKEMAKATAKYLKAGLQDGDVLAVTGGTTLAEVARSFPASADKRDIMVVPARGGLGEEVEKQANTVAANIAQRLGGTYRLLHVPDDVGEDVIASLCGDPKIREMLDLIKETDMVLHGIGTAEEMAKRRRLGEADLELLRDRKAVGEAFGYYFDRKGHIVYTTTSVGLRMEDLAKIDKVVAVGGGHTKAEAALAVMSNRYQHVCITDEGAARLMYASLGGSDATSNDY